MPQELNQAMLSAESLAEIAKERAKYPPERALSAVMVALRIAQDEKGWLAQETMDYIAELLEIRPIQVYEVATFYFHYDRKPVGRYKLGVCTSISCWLCGSDQMVDYLRKKLDVEVGETTADGRFTLKPVECLGACAGAPMMMVGNIYYENLTPAKLDDILDELK